MIANIESVAQSAPLAVARLACAVLLIFGSAFALRVEAQPLKSVVTTERARAELLASAAGVTLGPIISISEAAEMMPRPMPMMRAAAEAMPAPVPVEGGELGLSASVSIVWALEQ